MKRTLSLTAALLCVLSPVSSAKPLKVFILAGQSNMQGHVNVSTFGAMEDDRKTGPILKEMLAADAKPKVCEKVWISSIGCADDDTSWENKMKHMAKNYKPAEWKLLQGASNGGYHYLGAAKINPLFPRLRSGHRLFQRPSPKKQIPGSNLPREA